ncbi:hypothetical protein MD484_g1946, partial [Candolleomyces efflorescens]
MPSILEDMGYAPLSEAVDPIPQRPGGPKPSQSAILAPRVVQATQYRASRSISRSLLFEMECTIKSSLAANAASKVANMESLSENEDEEEDRDVEMDIEEISLHIAEQDDYPLEIRKEFSYDYVCPPTPIMQDLDELSDDSEYDEYVLGCDDLDFDMDPFEG